MICGAVGFADYLGFKGIWNKIEVKKLVKSIRSLERQLQEEHIPGRRRDWLMGELVFWSYSRIRIFFLSDSLCVTAVPRMRWLAQSWPDAAMLDALMAVSFSLSQASALSSRLEVPLAFRGAISTGEVYTSGNLLLGPAVDDAATHMSECQGALCWLTPVAKDFLQGVKQNGLRVPENWRPNIWRELQAEQTTRLIEEIFVGPYPLPLKSSTWVETYVVNPLIMNGWGGQPDKTASAIMETFDSPESDVALKRANTEEFLMQALKHALNRMRVHKFKPA